MIYLIPASNGKFIHSTTHTRIIEPLTEAGIAFQVIEQNIKQVPEGSLLLIDRVGDHDLSREEFKEWFNFCKYTNQRIIHLFDDNLQYDFATILQETRSRMSLISKLSTAAIVTTENLKSKYLSNYESIYVSPISLPSTVRFKGHKSKRHEISKVIKIGYMGSYTHGHDLMSILPQLADLKLNSTIPIEFEIIGGASDGTLFNFENDLDVRRLNPLSSEYLTFLSWFAEVTDWDFMLCPLVQSEFNSFKSDIKLLDAAMIGAIPIVTYDEPYKRTRNSERIYWSIDDLFEFVLDGEHRTEYCNTLSNLQNYVKAERLNNNQSQNLSSIIENLR
jgi:hypothetical protein